MTDTTPTTTPTTTPPAPASPVVELLHLDPATLVLDPNIRTNPRVGTEFLADVAENGVRVPLSARHDALGQVLVVDGQRRLTAALAASLPSVPVLVSNVVGDDESRILEQYRLNEQREALTTSEKAGAFAALFELGRTPDQIAKRMKTATTEVEAGLAVAGSKKAGKALAAVPNLDLVAAAGIAEFEGDSKVAAELAKVATADPSRLPYAIQAARNERDEAAALAAYRDELEQAGIKIIDWPDTRNKKVAKVSFDLTDAKGKKISAEQHATCPGHAVIIDTHHKDGGYAGAIISSWCLDWRKHGHTQHGQTEAATAAEAEAAATAERRRVRENNAAARAAEVVRRAFITDTVLQMGSYSVAAMTFAAQVIAWHAERVNDFTARELTQAWAVDAPRAVSTRVRAERAILAAALAAGESALKADSEIAFWRRAPKPTWVTNRTPLGVLQLRALVDAGYALSDLERTWLESYVEPKGGDA